MAKQKNRKPEISLQKTSSLAFYVLLIFTIIILPLTYSTSSLDPVLMLRLLLLSSFLTIFVVVFFNPKAILKFDIQILRQHLFKFWLSYLIISVLSLFFAINITEGLFDISKTATILVLLLCFSIAFTNFSGWRQQLPLIVTFAGLIASAIGFYQYFDKVLPNTAAKLDDGRAIIYAVTGLMGHKNQFSISLFLMLPFVGYGLFIYKEWKKWVSAISLVSLLVMILLLQTRAVWLGIIVATVTTAVVFLFMAKHLNITKKLRTYILIGFLAAFSISSVAIVFGGYNSYLARLKSIVNPQSHDNKYRLIIWKASLKMAAQHPFRGVGAGNWQLNLPRYLKGQGFTKEQLIWVRPHNDFLWVLTEKGILGLILFLSMFVIVFLKALQTIRRSENQKDKIFAFLIIFGLAGYLVDSFFDFPYERINQQVYLALLVASVLALNSDLPANKDNPPKISRFLIIAFIPFLLFSIVFASQAYQLETHLRKARIAIKQQKWDVLIEEGLKAKKPLKNLDAEVVPVDWFIGLGYFQNNNFEKAIFYYEKAKKANPGMVNVLNNLGQAYFKIKDYKNAGRNFYAALQILPTYREAVINLSSTLYSAGQYGKALKLLQTYKKKSRNSDPEIVARIESLKKMINESKSNQK